MSFEILAIEIAKFFVTELHSAIKNGNKQRFDEIVNILPSDLKSRIKLEKCEYELKQKLGEI